MRKLFCSLFAIILQMQVPVQLLKNDVKQGKEIPTYVKIGHKKKEITMQRINNYF